MYRFYHYSGLARFIFISFILLSSNLFAQEISNNWLGQKDIQHFYLRTYPDIHHNKNQGTLLFSEEVLIQDSFEKNYSQINELDYFITNTMAASLQCSSEILNENSEYIRYAYRLIVLSLLYESIEESRRVLNKLNSQNSCHVNWKKFLKKNCHPSSKEMSFFINNTRSLYESRDPKKMNISTKEVQGLWNGIKKDSYFVNNRASLNCKSQCNFTKPRALAARLSKTCKQDLSIFKTLCNEKDDLYGVTNSDIPYFLLLNSNVVNVFNSTGQAAGCLRQFSRMNQFKEHQMPILRSLLSLSYELTSQKYKKVSDQGQIFFNGAQKEFRTLGLGNVLVSNEVKKKKHRKVKVVEKVKEEDEYDPEIDDAIIIVEKKKIVPKPIQRIVRPKVVKKKVVFESAFVTAQKLFKKSGTNKVDVDMLKFKYDKIFSFEKLKVLEKKLTSLMTVKSLKEMKKYDALGRGKSPVPLTFIKFMIDTKKHQNLYNLTNIVGERFYAINDLERKVRDPIAHIKLINDFSSNYRWQISIVAPKKTKKSKK